MWKGLKRQSGAACWCRHLVDVFLYWGPTPLHFLLGALFIILLAKESFPPTAWPDAQEPPPSAPLPDRGPPSLQAALFAEEPLICPFDQLHKENAASR